MNMKIYIARMANERYGFEKDIVFLEGLLEKIKIYNSPKYDRTSLAEVAARHAEFQAADDDFAVCRSCVRVDVYEGGEPSLPRGLFVARRELLEERGFRLVETSDFSRDRHMV